VRRAFSALAHEPCCLADGKGLDLGELTPRLIGQLTPFGRASADRSWRQLSEHPLPQLSALVQVPALGLRLVVPTRLAAIDIDGAKHCSRHPVPLTGVAHLEELLGEEKRINQRLVLGRVPGRLESSMSGEVNVLVVDHDRGAEIRHDSGPSGEEKTPPGPEDGGELGQ